MTKEIRECIIRKKSAFKASDKAGVRAAQKNLNQLRKARLQYKEQVEQELSDSNTKEIWDSI